MIEISEKEYKRLKEIELKMQYLEAAGIDNTEAYDHAMCEYYKDNSEDDEGLSEEDLEYTGWPLKK